MHDTDRTLAELAGLDGEVGEADFELDGEDFENEGDFEFEPEAGTQMAYESDFEDEGDYEAETDLEAEAEFEDEADFEEEADFEAESEDESEDEGDFEAQPGSARCKPLRPWSTLGTGT